MKSLFVVGTFNIFDCIGRLTTSLMSVPSKYFIRITAALRILLLGTTIAALPNLGLGAPFNSDWYVVVNLIVLGYSHGITGSFAMIQGTMSQKNPEVAGYIMALHLTIGMALGSLFAYFISLTSII